MPDIIVTPNVGVTHSGTAKQVFTAFVLVAEILEGLTVGRGRRAIEGLLDSLPQTDSVLRGGQIVYVSIPTILPGEIVPIRPGRRIPVDGHAVSGQSFMEEAAIAGEPMPREKTAGNEVYVGTINEAGNLQVRADRLETRRPSARSLSRLSAPSIRVRPYRRPPTVWRVYARIA